MVVQNQCDASDDSVTGVHAVAKCLERSRQERVRLVTVIMLALKAERTRRLFLFFSLSFFVCLYVGGVRNRRELPFVTIVTDLGGAHPTWFNSDADKVFIASDAVMRVAFREGLRAAQVWIQHE